MQELDEVAKANNLILMNEIGLDPGIDHMSAMKVMDEIRAKGGQIILFESFLWWFSVQRVILIYGIINFHGIQEMSF